MNEQKYKTDAGSIILTILTTAMFFAATLIIFAAGKDASLYLKIGAIIADAALIFFLYALIKYEVLITNDSITSPVFPLTFIKKNRSLRLDEIEGVYNWIGALPECPAILLKSKNPDTKSIWLCVGLGLPFEALLDLTNRIPKTTPIYLESYVAKRLEKLRKKIEKKKISNL